MSDKPSTIVQSAIVGQFNEAHTKFICAAKAAAPNIVQAVNRMREMGILLKEVTGRECVTERSLRDWLRANPNTLAETEVAWLMAYVHTAKKLEQGELKLFEDASGYTQIVMQCAGLLSAPGVRELAQTSHELTPSVQSWQYVTTFKVHFENMLKGIGEWKTEQRVAVKENIALARKVLDELEARL